MLKKSDPVERILLRNNKLTEKTLGEIKANQLQVGRYLGKTLVDHGYIHADVLLGTLSKELSLPFISLEEYPKTQLPIKELNISGSTQSKILVRLIEICKPWKYPNTNTSGTNIDDVKEKYSQRVIREFYYFIAATYS